jgi:hypothetical protein
MNKAIRYASIGCFLLLAGALGSASAQPQVNHRSVNVLDFGAAGDGVADDTAILQGALDTAAANSGVTLIPCGVYAISNPLEIAGPVRLEDCAVIRAIAPMSAVVQIGSVALVKDGSFRGGVIDANNFAMDGLFLRQYAHFKVIDTEVLNARANGFHLGDTSMPGSSYEAILIGVHTRRTAGIVEPGSTGLLVDKNATDSNVSNAVFEGADIGVKTMTGGNFFTDIHVWSPVHTVGWMTIGFEDYGSGNFWRGCEADTVQLYGLLAHRYNTIVQGCRFFNNNIYGEDNAAVGIAFDLNTPYATVMANVFMGQDSSHRLALDIQGAMPSALKLFGNQYVNVTKHN